MLRYKVYEGEVEVRDEETYLAAIGYLNGRVDQVLEEYIDETTEQYGFPQLFHVERSHDRVEVLFNAPRDSFVIEIEEYQVEDEYTKARW